MALRRGFKSEAERIVRRLQKELDFKANQSIELDALAFLMSVEVIAGDKLIPRAKFKKLDEIQRGAFSACTLRPSENRIVVIYNPLSSESRRKSDIAHELAHILLGHDLSRIEKLGGVTFMTCDSVQEEEAAWLSSCLLLPRSLLLAEVRRGLDENEIAEKHGVSKKMARYRLNVTGVVKQNHAYSKGVT